MKQVLRVSKHGKQKAVIIPKDSPIQPGDFIRIIPLEVSERKVEVAV